MIKKRILALVMSLCMIICSTLPVKANNNKEPNSKIVLLARASAGGGGGSSSGGSRSSSGGGSRNIIGRASGGGADDPNWTPYEMPVDVTGSRNSQNNSSSNSGPQVTRFPGGSGNSLIEIGPGVTINASSGGGSLDDDGWVMNSNDNKWYYYENAGSLNANKATGWKEIGGSWYYFGLDGAMYQNTVTPDGYVVDSNGMWIK